MITAKKQSLTHSVWVAVRERIAPMLVLPSIFLFLAFLVTFTGVFYNTRAGVQAAASSTLNFQARLLSNTGQTVADGSYNIQFNLYTVATGGTTQWTETRAVSALQGVTVKNGYFSVNLGEITAFPGTIAWDQEQWLGMTVQGTASCTFGVTCTPLDAEMNPRFKLTAVPFAFRAGAVMNAAGTQAFTADNLVQLAPTAPQVLNLALSAISLNQTGAGGLLQLQGGGTDVFTVANNGNTSIAGTVLVQDSANSANAFTVRDNLGASFLNVDTLGGVATFGASGTSQTLLQAGTGGVRINSGANVVIGSTDATGTLLVIDTKNTAGDPTGTNGGMYYNSVLQKFRCYENGAWTDCIAGGSYDGTSASFVGGLQNVPANGTGQPIENMVFTSATAISNVAASGGYTAPANGSFRSCLVMNTANITAGTISLRWRVNGVSVGSPVCTMAPGATARQASSVINPGVVNFNAGDIIDLAFDTSNTFLPTGSNDFTVYWNVDYTGTAGTSAGDSLQDVYNQSVAATIQTANNKDIKLSLANTTIDSNFIVDIESGSNSRFILQNAGTETFGVSKDGSIVTSGGITLGTSSSTTPGTIRWTGTDFQGYDGANWLSLTAGSGGGGGGAGQNLVSIVKTVNETVISSNILQDDDVLTFPIGPNESWSYNFFVNALTQAAPDIQFAVSAPVGATCRYGYEDSEQAVSAGQFACGATTGLIAGDGLNNIYEISGTVQNGPTAGNITLRWAQNTANATNTIVYAGSYVQAVRSIGAGGAGQPFAQSGNSFGALAVLGTGDNNALSVITNNVERIRILATGETRFADDVIANGVATGTTGTTIATPGVNTTTVQLTAAGAFANNNVIYINNAGQDYYTRIVSGGGTTTLTVSPAVSYDAGAPVTVYTVQNIGATTTDYTSQANRFFQGYFLGGVVIGAGSTTISDGLISRSSGNIEITPGSGGVLQVNGTVNATTITGDGSLITNISGDSIVGGTIDEAALSPNVTLLNSAQNFSAAQTFGAGLTVTAGQTLTVNGDALTDLTGTGLMLNGSTLETTLGTSVDLVSEVTGTLTIASGGTGAANQQDAINALSGLTTEGDLLYFNGTNTTRLARGADGNCLQSTATGIVWGSCTTGAVTSIGTLDSQTKSANGAVFSSGALVLQTADASNPGLVSIGTQTFSGDKTFNGQIIGTAGLTVNGTAISLNTTGTASTSIGNASGALTLTGTSSSTFVLDGITLSTSEINALDGVTSNIQAQLNARLTAEADTLATVTGRSATTAVASSFTGGATVRGLTVDTATVTQDRILVTAAATGAARFDGSITNADLTAARTYTLPDASGTFAVTASGNIALSAAGNISLTGTIPVGNGGTGVTTTPTNGQLLIGNGTGYTVASLANNGGVTITTGAGTLGLAVAYGSSANTAAQGNVTFTCPSGTGNLSGGGTTITIGNGGTCGALTVINNPTFSGLLTANAGLTLGNGGSLVTQAGTDYSTTGTTNDVNLGASSFVRLTGASAQTITGITGGVNGRRLTIVNAGTATSFLANLTTSSAANQITTGTGANIALPVGSGIDLIYDGTANLWRVTGDVAGGTGNSVTSTAAITGTNANGLNISGNSINLTAADGTNGGALTASTQTIGGTKTFNAAIIAPTASNTINGLVINAGALSSVTTISASGAITGVGVNAGSGLLQGTGGLTITGATSLAATTISGITGITGTTTINTTGTATTGIGNATGALTVTGSSASTFVLNGVTVDATEFNRLDTKDATLLDTNDAVTTAITGTGALTAGSIGGSFGNINIGTNTFTGNGSGLTNLNGANISGSTITGIDAANITTGTLDNGRLSAAISFGTSVTTPVLTSTAALAISSGGTSALSFNSASNIIVIDATDTTLQRTAAGDLTIDLANAGATNLVLTNSAAGAASLNIAEGNLLTGGTTRLTNGGVLQNIAGLTIASGGASITGASSFADATSLNGNVIIGDAATDRLTLNSQILGANALVFQGATDNAFTTTLAITDPTANNTITLPNATGTVLLLGASAIQTDASTNASIAINKTGATGNILTLQKNGTGVFTIANDGATLIQLNSATAFNVRNTTGTDQFIIDSTNSLVRVGSATADGTATVLISDAKNTTGDPVGAGATNGAQYYNSFWQQYRCYRDGAWETCGVNPIDRAFVMNDEFMSGYTGAGCTTATAIIGDQNWTCFTNGTANTSYNVGTILPTADRPGIIRMTTAAANGNGFTMALAGNNSGSVVLAPQNRVKAAVGQGATITNNRLRVGLHAQTTSNAQPTTGVWWEADSTTNALWRYCYGTGAVATCANATGFTITANTMYSLDIRVTATGAGTSAATFIINGTSFTVSGVTISTAARVNPAISCFNSVNAARECYVDYFQFSGVAAARR